MDGVLETSTPSLPPVGRSADESDDDDVTASDDVTTGARSSSPSSDVENILEALRDTTTVYFGDFTLRRVFSLEEELVTHRPCKNDASDSAGPGNLKPPAPVQANRDGDEDDRQSAQTIWTLPLARRLTPGAIGKNLTRVVRRFNGITQERSSTDDAADCSRLSDNSSATAAIHGPGCPVDGAITPSRADVVHEKDRATVEQVLPVETVCIDWAHADALTTTCDGIAGVDVDIRRPIGPTQNGLSNQTQATTTTTACSASSNVDELPQPQLELSGIPYSSSEVASSLQSQSAAPDVDGLRQTKIQVSSRLKPVQRSSSNRDASRPPIQPRASSPGASHWRRSATPSRASVDCLPGLTTVGVSRTSSCEVLVDDDDLRLTDVVTRHSGVTRRSSCTSSVADDGESTAASETDSAAIGFDVDDLIANSLLDSLLMRLRSSPRASPSSCGRRPSTQMSVSSSSDEETDPYSGVDVTAVRAHTSRIVRKHCSLLSSLDDITSDSDFELGFSLSQLVLTSGQSPRHPSTSQNNERLSSSSDLPGPAHGQTDKQRNWLDNSSYLPPRPALDLGTSVNGELVNGVTSEGLSAPITESQPAQIHVARTSRIPKY